MTLLQNLYGPVVSECPQCGAEQEDLDGFGVLACIPGCGWCSHPERNGGVCSICGDADDADHQDAAATEALRLAAEAKRAGNVDLALSYAAQARNYSNHARELRERGGPR